MGLGDTQNEFYLIKNKGVYPVQSIDHGTLEIFQKIEQKLDQSKKAFALHKQLRKIQNKFVSLQPNSWPTQTTSLTLYCQKLLKRPFISSFSTIHVFVHIKGNSEATHFEVDAYGQSNSAIQVNEFNNLLQSIRKSKNKSFGQSDLRGSSYNILGTFLAHESSFENFNFIFLLSKNDFIPQDDLSIQQFNSVKKFISGSLKLIISKEIDNNKLNTIHEIINNLPLDIEIRLLDGEYQSQNDLHILRGKLVKINNKSSVQKVKNAEYYHSQRMLLLGDLLNTLHHELSNPLFGLKLSTELLIQDAEDTEQREMLTEILNAQNRSQKILMSFSNLFSQEGRSQKTNLKILIKEVFTLTKAETRNIQKNLIIDDSCKNQLDTFVNPTWLFQILFNLILNSGQELNQKRILSPTIVIEVKLTNSIYTISIKDNGPGIREDAQENIFTPFYTTKTQGTGLGLAISRDLARKLNGQLLYIPSNSGAQFELTFPIKTKI